MKKLAAIWVKQISTIVFLVSVVAAVGNAYMRFQALRQEAQMYYQPLLAQANLTSTFHIVYFLTLEIAVALAFALTGLIIAWHKPATRMTIFAASALMLYGVTIPPPMHALVVNLPFLPLPLRFIRGLGLGLFVSFFYIFPNGRFTPRWTLGLAVALGTWSLIWPFYSPLNPYTLPGMLPFFVLSACLGTGAVAQLYRYFRSSPEGKQQTKWVVFGLTASVLGDLITHSP